MKVQQDSFEERSESPDLPEPLYEEVGDFGLQVLKSLETSFLSSSTAETQEVLDRLPLRLVPVETARQDHFTVPDPVRSVHRAADAPELSGDVGGDGEPDSDAPQQQPAAGRRQQLQRVCTPSQELLLQELSSAFTKKTEEEEEEEEEERPYDV